MQTRTRNALLLFAIALTASTGLGALWRARHASSVRSSAIDAVPTGAMLVAVVDLEALRAAPAFAPLFRSSREIPGLGAVREVCGSDPMDTLREMALSVPEAGDAGELGLAAVGEVDDDAVVACASKVIERRGGRPVVTPIGAFRSVRDASMATTGGEIAVRKGGPVLLGSGNYLRSMIDAADGRIAGVRSQSAHSRLSREIGEGALRVTVALTAEQRETLASELRQAGAASSPASSIASAGLSLRLGPEVTLHAVLTCDASSACAELGRSFEAARQARAADPMLRLVGAGRVLELLRIQAEGELLHGRVDLPADQAAALVERLLALRAQRREDPGAATEPPSAPNTTASAAPDSGAPGRPEKGARSRPRTPKSPRKN